MNPKAEPTCSTALCSNIFATVHSTRRTISTAKTCLFPNSSRTSLAAAWVARSSRTSSFSSSTMRDSAAAGDRRSSGPCPLPVMKTGYFHGRGPADFRSPDHPHRSERSCAYHSRRLSQQLIPANRFNAVSAFFAKNLYPDPTGAGFISNYATSAKDTTAARPGQCTAGLQSVREGHAVRAVQLQRLDHLTRPEASSIRVRFPASAMTLSAKRGTSCYRTCIPSTPPLFWRGRYPITAISLPSRRNS